MESLHDYGYQCVLCDVHCEIEKIDLALCLSPDESCPACDVKNHWDYLSTLVQYKIGAK